MKERKLSKKKSQQILATLVMGMNLVNSMAPMAAAMQKLPAEGELQVQKPKSEAKPLEYTVLPQAFNYVENLVIGRAEAAEYDVASGQTSSLAEMGSGDRMTISAGGIGTVSTMSGGTQNIYLSGIGTVDTMSSGYQFVFNKGTAYIDTLNDGYQTLSGGTGAVNIMNDGHQNIYSGGTGNVSIISGGTQNVYNSGIINMMSGGTQNIFSGGTGIVSNMDNGN